MARNSAQNALMRDETRRLLLDAAARVFVARGFAAARMADIASEAGVGHGLAYHYFQNKEAVFIAVVELTTSAAAELVDAVRGVPDLDAVPDRGDAGFRG